MLKKFHWNSVVDDGDETIDDHQPDAGDDHEPQPLDQPVTEAADGRVSAITDDRLADAGSVAEANPDLRVGSLLDDPALRRAMGLEVDEPVDGAVGEPLPAPVVPAAGSHRRSRQRALESAAA